MRIPLLALTLVLLVCSGRVRAEETPEATARAAAALAAKNGNWKVAWEASQKLVLDPKTDPQHVSSDLAQAFQCLNQLGQHQHIDALLEKATATHGENWRLLFQAAQTYNQVQHYGYIVGGVFTRGQHRGGGQYTYTMHRDRALALQLMLRAKEKLKGVADQEALFDFYHAFAHMIHHDGSGQSWRLQALTELSVLPDYEENYQGYGSSNGAPVDRDGQPVFHKLPRSWEEAASDGERWRFMLMQAAEAHPARAGEVSRQYAAFLRQQFDVQTMAHYGRRFGHDTGEGKDESGPFAVKTLGEDETMARLASGVKRFKLPAEHNFIKMYQDLAAKEGAIKVTAHVQLGQIFEDRQQYVKAVAHWKAAGQLERAKQITGNWGVFEPSGTFTAGEPAQLDYRFRNGAKVNFTAHEIKVEQVLQDVKAHLKANPKQLDWHHVQIEQIGWRIVERNEKQYLGEQVAAWAQDLKPREGHFDRRVSVETPLKKPGAYLVSAQMADGNTSRMVVWVADTVIVQKNLDQKTLYYVADANTGQPVPGAELSLFGYQQTWANNKHNVTTTEVNAVADAHGLHENALGRNNGYQWLITARNKDGRFAFQGFTHSWQNQYHDQVYNQPKVFFISDRPAYRPGHAVKFKFWATKAQYDAEGNSPFAGRNVTLQINNPKGEKVHEKTFTLDEFGGLDGEYLLPKDATLGQYSIHLPWSHPDGYRGSGSFRVEEYKKPEFEVKIEAPKEPVMLGEKIAATVQAKYYFGAPVSEGKLKYKVLRHEHSANWYPHSPWDWMYAPGYWWFACDYPWYPGWREWGCKRPYPWWYGQRHAPPEVVAENEVQVGADGTVKIEIDTLLAKLMHGDSDHRYEISAEVTDSSRRTIYGSGSVMVARKPFKVYTWVDRGHYRTGDTVQASFNAQTLDQKGVQGKAAFKLYKVSYKDGKPEEKEINTWDLAAGEDGRGQQQLTAGDPGQYRLSCAVTDAQGHVIEGGQLFVVTGEKFDGRDFRFNELELVAEKREYKPGESMNLMVNVNRADAAVLLFVRPANGVYLTPKFLAMKGKSTVEAIEVLKKDMPNFFVEALTVANGRVHTETREVIVPPESRVLKVDVKPSKSEYKPGEKAKVEIKLTEMNGEPFSGSTVVSIYDKSVEYISGGSNVAAIKDFFWKWRRGHHPRTESSLSRSGSHLHKSRELQMQYLGVFGALVADLDDENGKMDGKEPGAPGKGAQENGGFGRGEGSGGGDYDMAKQRRGGEIRKSAAASGAPMASSSKMENLRASDKELEQSGDDKSNAGDGTPDQQPVQPTVRKNFADTAYWNGLLNVGSNGVAEIELTMPENLTGWKIRTWALGKGARVGEGTAEIVTAKNLLVRLQAPRFFTQKDEVVLSANVHNYLKTKKSVTVTLELDGSALAPMENTARPADGTWKLTQTVEIEPKGEKRVDWRVKVLNPGEAVVRMKALTDEESDAMEMRFPAYIHGMSKLEAVCGVIRPDKHDATVNFNIPAQRMPEQSRLEVRYTPTLAGAMVDALPYMIASPCNSTEHTLDRFLPTVVTQNVLTRMGISLKDVREKLTNLNAQEIGDDKERAKQWQRYAHAPVFDESVLKAMVKAGAERLATMQCSDGGWGWFSGWGEHSDAHTTAYMVHGLQIARANDVQLEPNMVERGIGWLKNYEAQEIQKIKNGTSETKPYKKTADNLDAFVYMVLADAGKDNTAMREFLYRDRNHLAVYSKAMFGLALHKLGHMEKRDMLVQNVAQFLKQDDENQTAWLELPQDNYWWYWYGSEYEAHAYYLKLLSAVEPKGEKAPRLVKYLLNNRKNATYWNSTRDTAVCIEALADYLKASGEDKPDLALEIYVNGQKKKEVTVNASNLFTFDNVLVMSGAKDLPDGALKIEIRKKGTGPLYFNAYSSHFSLEDHIAKAGLEVKVERTFYKLKQVEKKELVEGQGGQALTQKGEKYERELLPNLSTLKSGDLVEIELVIESKNDYEYLLFEDMKAAGFEAVDVRSGYLQKGLHAYMELRDERVCFFVRTLARGKHSVSYKMRAEIPGKFSALPTRASAMYAPELKANADEIKLNITD